MSALFAKRRLAPNDFSECATTQAYGGVVDGLLDTQVKRYVVSPKNIHAFLKNTERIDSVFFNRVDLCEHKDLLADKVFVNCHFFDCLTDTGAVYEHSCFTATGVGAGSLLSNCTVQGLKDGLCRIGSMSVLHNVRIGADVFIGKGCLYISDNQSMVVDSYYEPDVMVCGGTHKHNRYAHDVAFHAALIKPVLQRLNELNDYRYFKNNTNISLAAIKELDDKGDTFKTTIFYPSRLNSLEQLPVKSKGSDSAYQAVGVHKGSSSLHNLSFVEGLIRSIYFNKPGFDPVSCSQPGDVRHFVLTSGTLFNKTARNFVSRLYEKAGIDTKYDYINPDLITELSNFACQRHLSSYNDIDDALKRVNEYTKFLKVDITMDDLDSFFQVIDKHISYNVGRRIEPDVKLEGALNAG